MPRGLSPLEIARQPLGPARRLPPAELDAAATGVHRRAGWAFWLLVAYAGAGILPVLIGIVLGTLHAGAPPARLEALTAPLERMEMAVRFVAFFAAGAAFLTWKYAAYRLLPGLTGRETDHAAGWAPGSYFIPFLNFFRPYTIMAEVWDESESDQSATALGDGAGGRWILQAWWALWIGAYLLERVGALAELEGAQLSSVMGFAAAGAFAALVVRGVDARQQARAAEVVAGHGFLSGGSVVPTGVATQLDGGAVPPSL